MDSAFSSPAVIRNGNDQNKQDRIVHYPPLEGLTDAEVDEVINNPELGLSGYFDNRCRHDVTIWYGKQGKSCMFGHRVILRRRSEWFRRELERSVHQNGTKVYIMVKKDMNPEIFEEAMRLIYDCRPKYGKGKTQKIRDMRIEFVDIAD